MGGWAHICPEPVVGTCRALHYWSDLSGVARFALGTNERLYLEQSGALTDITPNGFTPGTISSGATPFSLVVWSIDNFGQNLVATASGQGLFTWIPGQAGPAAQIATAPSHNQGLFVHAAQQIVMAYGCTPIAGGAGDPMLVRWSTQSDDTDWLASTTNQAGSYRLPRGNRIIAGLQMPNFALLWTDLDLWMVTYIGFPLVFSFTQIGSNCGIIAQHAVVVAGGVPYWSSDHGFFRLAGGGAEQIPCPVWDIFFKDLSAANADKCLAGLNYHYSEVYFWFPSASGGSGEIDSYVKINIQEGEWDYGGVQDDGTPNPMARTAWTDYNQPGDPIGVDLKGLMQQQEQGFTVDGGIAVPAMIRSGFADVSDGEDILNIDVFIPDFKWSGADAALDFTMFYRAYPGTAETELGPFRITPQTEQMTLVLPRQLTIGTTNFTTWGGPRCREMAFQLTNVRGWWRLGACRWRGTKSGKL